MVSVCMCTYNGERFIRDQIDSILPQLGRNDELIVSDDGSTDKTISVVESFKDPRIRVLHHRSCGVPYNFENALLHAKGDFVFLCDQDDVWHPEKVCKCMCAFNAGYDLVVTDARIINANGDVVEQSFFAIKHSGPGFLRNLWQNTYLGCCMAFRSSFLSWLLPFPKRINMHDEWIGLFMSFVGSKQIFMTEPLMSYRQHGGNVTQSISKSRTSMIWKIRKRLRFVCAVVHRFWRMNHSYGCKVNQEEL